ncbi:7-cyano-7-deazaguanine synthase QueC [Prevotella sp. E9-3]|uniref:7-cyano-7-deazaguanine synthase QueC n=1 Tax=Prevotella sp. E9-3 TaxID=2913621 RepID=UPI001ED9CF66|nr:7-cyano-7-deazaguanine synthase QueC [Prevotella sp. E9-3]UKK49597.1 7-cyano-7-deazaguanine synthase QueC [Prevotella sp. E9-3]
MKDSVIILSGGMDSVTMLYEFEERIALAVSFDYGSNHNAREIPFAHQHCMDLGIRHIVIPLEFMSKYFKSSLLEGPEAIPEGHYEDENMKSTVVPFRNGIMLSIAVGIAESAGLKHVMMANHGGDHTIYPDCREEFVNSFSEAARTGTYVGVTLLSPYTNLTKADIARKGKELGVDYSKTWSCYKGGVVHCGRCGTCVERREALAEAGIEDPTEYQD